MKKYLLIILCLMCYLPSFSQSIVTGKVIDAHSKSPLSGAGIKAVSNENTVSDQNGNFKINLKQIDTVIYVSYIGYSTEIVSVKKFNDTIIVYLKQAENLLDVVNVSSGYQIMPKERIAGSFTQIGKDLLNEQVSTDIMSRLSSVTNGLVIDKSSSSSGRLLIRGLSTVRGPNAPLIILDNFPYEGDIQNINPNFIESVTILKDASAASIWGARAGNGVVVITTKKGSFNKPLQINVAVTNTFTSTPDLQYLRQISSDSFISIEEELYKRNYYASSIASLTRPQVSPVVELLVSKSAGQLSEDDYKNRIDYLRKLDVRDEFAKHFYNRAYNQQYSVNFSGGDKKYQWSTQTGYDHNKSELDAVYKRTNLRFQNSFKPIDNLQFSADLLYTQSLRTSGKPGYGDINASVSGIYPYAQFADDQGMPLPIAKRRQAYINSLQGSKLLDWNYFPLTDHLHSLNERKINDIIVNTGLNYKFLDGFSADLKFQYQQQRNDSRNHWNEQSYFARNLINTFSQTNVSSGELIQRIPFGGILDLATVSLNTQNLRGQINYQKSWGNHDFNIIAGQEIRNAKTLGNGNRTYGYNDDILTFSNVDYNTQFPEFISGSLSQIPQNHYFDDKTVRFVSLYSNAAYSYKSKYSATMSLRRDASNIFGISTNNKWTPLWSIGGSWEISKEPFFTNKSLNYLRLRATYGINGNIDPAMSTVSTIRYIATNPNIPGAPYAQFNQYANPELSWEVSKTTNIGIDFRLANSKLNGSIDIYQKNGENLFGFEQLDYTGGIGTNIVKNTASIVGKGIDVELNSTNINHHNFAWKTHFNFSFNKDKVIKYYLLSRAANNFVGSTNAVISAIEGTPIYSIYSYKWAGLNPSTGDPRGYFNNQISQNYSQLLFNSQIDDLKYHGPASPVFFGSIGNTFSYKQVSLSFRIVYKLGYYFRRSTINYTNMFSTYNGDVDYVKRWQNSGDELKTYVPSIIYSNNANRDAFYAGSEPLVERGDHFRLQYININYTPDVKRLPKFLQNNLSLFFNISELGILWKANKHDIDPDYRGINTLKPSTNFSFGLRAAIN